MHVKGLEVAMHDPRHMPGILKNYPVSPIGGDHPGTAYGDRTFRNVIGLCHFLNFNQEQVIALTRAIRLGRFRRGELHTWRAVARRSPVW